MTLRRPNLPEADALWAKDLERRLRALENVNQLDSSSIGAGGLAVKDGGTIEIQAADGTVLVGLDSSGLVVRDAAGNVVFARTTDLWIPFRQVVPFQAAAGGDAFRQGYRVGSGTGAAGGAAATFYTVLWGGVRECWEQSVWMQVISREEAIPFDVYDIRFTVRKDSPFGTIVDSETFADKSNFVEQWFAKKIDITYNATHGQKGTARYFTVDVKRDDNRDTTYTQPAEPFLLGYSADLPAEQDGVSV